MPAIDKLKWNEQRNAMSSGVEWKFTSGCSIHGIKKQANELMKLNEVKRVKWINEWVGYTLAGFIHSAFTSLFYSNVAFACNSCFPSNYCNVTNTWSGMEIMERNAMNACEWRSGIKNEWSGKESDSESEWVMKLLASFPSPLIHKLSSASINQI